MNVVLIGYRCSGKTLAGKIIAGKLGREFMDTDRLIEHYAGCSIVNIVSRAGWEHFREIEKRVIEEVSQKDDLVIATGGGVVLAQKNVRSLKRNGWVVWLNGKVEVLKQRMLEEQRAGRVRPALKGVDPIDEVEQVLAERSPLYKQASDFMVDTSALSPEKVALLIMDAIPVEMKGKGCAG
ncbi:MAG: shikimate kinase [Deltaproteobacteria bacterium]|nr:shikimate kinase [Deltaproteobacteria bacterium]MBW2017857.1 shikimate kinase [Deltaproteobacteria bacterium]MBW2129814.1 shikimate kinase [Deltaproteobacteria bacterium]MBW2304896.1 shikimate kinase [Deltaproteobacteria bacterium]